MIIYLLWLFFVEVFFLQKVDFFDGYLLSDVCKIKIWLEPGVQFRRLVRLFGRYILALQTELNYHKLISTGAKQERNDG